MTNTDIIYQDDSLLVINKPAGISVTKDRTGADDILKILKENFPENEFRLIHRLDKETSGIMILAKTPETQSLIAGMFAKRQVKKTYLALVTGAIMNKNGRINAPLAHDKKNPRLMRIDPRRGKPAVTEWRLLADFGPAALLAVNPVTGRTHQIRVHMASRSMPLVIDPLYGGTRPVLLSDFKTGYLQKKDRPEKPLIERLTLHAYQIQLNLQNQEKIFTAPLDRKFAATIKMLTKHNKNGKDAFINEQDYTNIIEATPI
ncbi:MAG: RNA pseudouridine synthase [Sedimentisphaerales bacterium]|nr:RNA pseudouridine synthase [Sedimentisphaerales bacterium]